MAVKVGWHSLVANKPMLLMTHPGKHVLHGLFVPNL